MIKSRKIIWAGHVARMGERRCVYRVVVGKSEVKRPIEKSRLRREVNIRTNLQEVGCRGMNWLRIGRGGGLL